MDELIKARRTRDEAFENFFKHSVLETKHYLAARKWRNEHRMAADEVRALERDLLSAPIQPLYEKNN